MSSQPEALSCMHRHEIGCLLLNSPLCCRCADCSSVSEFPPWVDPGDSLNHAPGLNLSKYCASCQEYWRTQFNYSVSEIPINEILQSSVAAFNLPETTAEIESYRADRIRDSYGVSVPGAGLSGSSAHPGFQYRPSLSHHGNNITTLRHELDAISTDISRVLSSLHDLRQDFPTSRYTFPMENATTALRGPSGVENRNIPTLTGNPGPLLVGGQIRQPQESANSDAGSQNMDIDTPEMATTSTDSTFGGENNHNQHNQGSQQIPQTPLVTVPRPNFVPEPAASHVRGHAGTTANGTSNFGHTANANANANANGLPATATATGLDRAWPRGGSQQPWLLEHQMAAMRGPYVSQGFGAAGTAAMYASGVQHSARAHAGGPLQTGATSNFPPAFVPTFPSMSSATTMNFSSPMQPQSTPVISRANTFTPAQPVFTYPHVIYPTGSSAFGFQRLHHNPHPHPHHGADGVSLNGATHNQHRSHNSRRRSRRMDDQGPHVPRRPSPPRFEGSASYFPAPNSAFVSVPTEQVIPPPGVSVPRRADTSTAASHSHHRPSVSSVRSFPDGYAAVDSLLRQLSHEQQATSNVAQPQSQSQGTANGNQPAAAEDPNAPRGLDDPRSDRPEAKENDDMQVNLECKVCMTQMVDTVLLPCGHAVLCRWCAEQMVPLHSPRSRAKDPPLCPMCRQKVRQSWRIYLN